MPSGTIKGTIHLTRQTDRQFSPSFCLGEIRRWSKVPNTLKSLSIVRYTRVGCESVTKHPCSRCRGRKSIRNAGLITKCNERFV